MKVNYSDKNRNEEFLKAYPSIPAYPHLFVLDSDGRLLHSQGTGELEKGRDYDEEVFLAFLKQWQPAAGQALPADAQIGEKQDAETVLAVSLERARVEDKRVLIHLSAPT